MSAPEITALLAAWNRGESGAQDELFRAVLRDLRQLARAHLAHERPHHTLQPTALVHELYLRLAPNAEESPVDWQNRAHFFGVCRRIISRVLTDYGRRRGAQKRGAGAPMVPLHELEGDLGAAQSRVDWSGLAEALADLAKASPRACQVVQLRYFLGLSGAETADALGISQRTVRNDWQHARAWLYRALESEGPA